jgi:transcriptional regulator with XRE-family HTH domain
VSPHDTLCRIIGTLHHKEAIMLAEVIREVREGHAWTVRELARQSGVSHTQIGRIESGEIATPSVVTLTSLARAFARNPRPLLIVAGHITGDSARAELGPMFREHAELVEAWGDWAHLTIEQARALLDDPASADAALQRLAAEVFVGPETEETLWEGESEALALPTDADPRLHSLLTTWRYLADERRDQLVAYSTALHKLEDLEFQVGLQITEDELQLDAALIPLESSGQQSFDEDFLREQGFAGFVRASSLPPGAPNVPDGPGVYVVVRRSSDAPEFLDASVGGHFKGKNPSAAVKPLSDRWVERASVVYIGRASNLRQRLHLLARFGRGEAVGHWGGRYLWQLADHDQLMVAWQETNDQVEREAELVASFFETYGSLPFANINQPRGLALA